MAELASVARASARTAAKAVVSRARVLRSLVMGRLDVMDDATGHATRTVAVHLRVLAESIMNESGDACEQAEKLERLQA